jgi:RNA polymerase sigma-70 factor (ECF subfamily)
MRIVTNSSNGDWIAATVARYQGPLTAYAARLLGDVDLARDVVQDTFLKLWQAKRESVEGHLAAWLYTVCRNRALDVLRKDGRMTSWNDGQVATGVQEPEPRAERIEHRFFALEALQGLPPRQQEVIRLKFQGGLSYREIAEVMDLTVSHVGVLIHTAIKTIRQQLEGSVAASPVRTRTQAT